MEIFIKHFGVTIRQKLQTLHMKTCMHLYTHISIAVIKDLLNVKMF